MTKKEEYIVLNDKRKLGYAEFGSPNGWPIIYLHGSQSSRLEMHHDLTFAVKNNLRIITIDRPGHGLSDFNPDGTILSFCQDVKHLCDHLEISHFSVAGMSAGSPFALAMAHQYPEIIHKVSIISGFAPFTKANRQHLGKEVKAMLALAKSLPFLLKIMLRMQEKQLKKNPKKALQGFLKILSEPDQAVLKKNAVMDVIESMFIEAFRNGSKGVAYEISQLLVRDWKFDLGKIQSPVCFWQGKRDNNVPFQWAENMSKEIPHSSLKIFDNEGHLIIFNHAEEIFVSLKPKDT